MALSAAGSSKKKVIIGKSYYDTTYGADTTALENEAANTSTTSPSVGSLFSSLTTAVSNATSAGIITATDTTDTEDDQDIVYDDSETLGSSAINNVLLRRRKIQAAMKYGFASTLKGARTSTTTIGRNKATQSGNLTSFVKPTESGVVGA